MLVERTKPITINLTPRRGEVLGEACYVCGRNTNPARRRWVRIVDGGGKALHAGDIDVYEAKQKASNDGYDRGDCGAWPIGTDCCRKQSLKDYSTK